LLKIAAVIISKKEGIIEKRPNRGRKQLERRARVFAKLISDGKKSLGVLLASTKGC
jgi:hypothetical protein